MQKKVFSNILSASFGKFASKKFGKGTQTFINSAYVNIMGLDMREFDEPSSYESLNALFTRALKTARQIDNDPKMLISPTDSKVTELGKIEDFKAFQIKGMSYQVDSLLGEHITQEHKERIKNGNYINLYLSPRDYHRYHAPCDMKVTKAIHIPAKLYPVNIPTLKRKVNLFIENERVVLECLSREGKLFYYVLIGALNVGQMVVEFEKNIETNSDMREINAYEYQNLHLKKGDLIGYFKMGSTVVMLLEEGFIDLDAHVGDVVKFGQAIAHLTQN